MTKNLLSNDEIAALNSVLHAGFKSDLRRRMSVRTIVLNFISLYYFFIFMSDPGSLVRLFNPVHVPFGLTSAYELISYRALFIICMVTIYNVSYWFRLKFIFVSMLALVVYTVMLGVDFQNFYLFAKPEALVRISIMMCVRMVALYLLVRNFLDAFHDR